ncbi:hypothetical protein MUO14_08390 [Halobacillus shinanisalinarum]|uniref:Uncharacterized protein n=1 Tax=Halobacillus shinanisalinarum TaxID=2932258 RepID=A0ABY4H3A5_9BACI|nr:hypothetical protein [Halobacillus shinanisalinarum]UOQ94930.1 hypothetical protein MUO14_08390 [Halobacillus shinanisalinarum]
MQKEGTFGHRSNRNGVFGEPSNATTAALSYGMLFVAFMLVTGGTITINGLGLPAIGLFVMISFVQYMVKGTPRWLVLGSFTFAVGMAVVMGLLLQ